MQQAANFRANIYSRENAFAGVPSFDQPQEFVRRRAPPMNSFAAFLPKSESARPQQLWHISKAENALGGWIRALERSGKRHSSSSNEQKINRYMRDRFKLNRSDDDIRKAKPILPRHNLQLLRDVPFQDEELLYHDHYGNARRAPILPVNAIDHPIGKFLLKGRFGRTDSDDAEYRRQNTHPPAELVRVHRDSFDKDAKLAKAYREWVKILTSNPAAVGSKPSRRRRPRAAAQPREYDFYAESDFDTLPRSSAGYEPLARGGGCCCRRAELIPPRLQISPPRGTFRPVTHYHDHFGTKFGPKTEMIWPRDGMSPPHGHILSNTSYAQDYLDKSYSRREPIILPGGISPPHGVVSSSTHYAEHYPDHGYSKREMIVRPGGISPPRGNFSSDTSYARDYQECSHCQRGYIVPPSGISPPTGHVSDDTAYREHFGDKGCNQRSPIRLLDAISPPSGVIQQDTTYNQTFHGCSQCFGHPQGQSTAILAQESSPQPASVDDASNDFFPESPTEFKNEPEVELVETADHGTPVDTTRLDSSLCWGAEPLDGDISRMNFCKAVRKKRYDNDQQLARRNRTKRRIKVVQRTEAQSESPDGYLKVPPLFSPKPPTAIKRLFATSYSKSYVAESMRNLN